MDERVEVEWVILADYAETINNKVFLMGGGWETLTVNSGFPVQHPCAIVVAFTVPWTLTNRTHQVELVITDQDEHRSLLELTAQIEVGRPVGIPPGQPQRVPLAIKMMLEIEEPGGYVIKARVEEQERRARFNVVPGAGVRVMPRQGG